MDMHLLSQNTRISLTLYFWMFIREISHGFNGTQDYLVMGRNFKYIFVIFLDIFFKNNVMEIVNKMSTFHIHIRGPDCIQALPSWML